jgi:hypothetical protein
MGQDSLKCGLQERREGLTFVGFMGALGERILVSMMHLQEEEFWFLWFTSREKRRAGGKRTGEGQREIASQVASETF